MIDFSEFEVVAPVTRRPTKQVVSIFADGTFAINGELKKHIRANKFEVQIKKDFSQILLLPEGKVITDMGKNDRIKNYAVREKFMKKKNENAGILYWRLGWAGQLLGRGAYYGKSK